MDLSHILMPERTLCNVAGISKKRFFETAARLFADEQHELGGDDVYTALLAREKLGSTALGNGIAIPHCRIADCSQAMGGLITLADPIDFEAPDRQRVNLLFVLIVPLEGHQEHLDILAGLAGLLSQASFCATLCAATNAQQLYRAAVGYSA